MATIIAIAKAGLNRFYDEGFTCWPEDKLRAIFSNQDIEVDPIKTELESWQKSGWIELPKTKLEYLNMLEIIPD